MIRVIFEEELAVHPRDSEYRDLDGESTQQRDDRDDEHQTGEPVGVISLQSGDG